MSNPITENDSDLNQTNPDIKQGSKEISYIYFIVASAIGSHDKLEFGFNP